MDKVSGTVFGQKAFSGDSSPPAVGRPRCTDLAGFSGRRWWLWWLALAALFLLPSRLWGQLPRSPDEGPVLMFRSQRSPAGSPGAGADEDAPPSPRGGRDGPGQRVFRRPGSALKLAPPDAVGAAGVSAEAEVGQAAPDFGAAGQYAPERPGLLGRLGCPGLREHLFHCPIARESWLQRPFSVTWFLGMVQGSSLISDWIDQERGLFGGLKFGLDFDHYWGAEMRLAFGSAGVHDSQRAIAAQVFADDQAGLAANDPFRFRFDGGRNAALFLWDLDVLYYPWGDTPWRPYVSVGLGTAQLNFQDRLSKGYADTLLGMPLAVGLKYHGTNALALRLECADNIALGAHGINTLHQFSIIGGLEFRLGGSHKAYWPWNPGRNYW
jgi:hypothetical protein